MTILVCLGSTPQTWWQAKNVIGKHVLDRAASIAEDESARDAINLGTILQLLAIHETASPLREQIWQAVERAAVEVHDEPPQDWRRDEIDHVGELAREMQARRDDPARPGVWP